jgi:hypothetical protein
VYFLRDRLMARKVRIVNARDFVSAKPDGTLNLEEG